MQVEVLVYVQGKKVCNLSAECGVDCVSRHAACRNGDAEERLQLTLEVKRDGALPVAVRIVPHIGLIESRRTVGVAYGKRIKGFEVEIGMCPLHKPDTSRDKFAADGCAILDIMAAEQVKTVITVTRAIHPIGRLVVEIVILCGSVKRVKGIVP